MEETIKYGLQNVDWLETLVKYTLGIMGIIVYSVWKVREHLVNFRPRVLIKENTPFWIWSISMISLVLIILTLSPDTANALKTMIGLDVSGEPASFLLLGWSLSAFSNSITKKKLDSKVTQ